MDITGHKFFLVQILKEIYSDIELENILGFKGGTALMLFYDLPRFSGDLDFNLLEHKKSSIVFEKIDKILLKFETIKDKARKHYGIISVLDYSEEERNLKIEISERNFPDSFEIKNFLGINMKVMQKQDMFAHKLCALTDRKAVTGKDVFDCWFFMENRTPVNKNIVELRMKVPLEKYLDSCVKTVSAVSSSSLAGGFGELVDPAIKTFVKNRLKDECITVLKMYGEMLLTPGR